MGLLNWIDWSIDVDFLDIKPDNYAFKEGPPASECTLKSVNYKGLCIPAHNKYTKYIVIVTIPTVVVLLLFLKSWKLKTKYKKPEKVTEPVKHALEKRDIA